MNCPLNPRLVIFAYIAVWIHMPLVESQGKEMSADRFKGNWKFYSMTESGNSGKDEKRGTMHCNKVVNSKLSCDYLIYMKKNTQTNQKWESVDLDKSPVKYTFTVNERNIKIGGWKGYLTEGQVMWIVANGMATWTKIPTVNPTIKPYNAATDTIGFNFDRIFKKNDTTSATNDEVQIGAIAGVASFLFIVGVTVAFLFFRWKKTRATKMVAGTKQDAMNDSREISIESLLKNTVRVPTREEFDELEKNDRKRSGINSDLTMSQGRRYNDGKHGKMNIDRNVLPYDQNRVKLENSIKGVDYINASWVQRVKECSTYDDLYDFMPSSSMNIILTQDPTPDTKQHYLRLIHEQRIDVIVHIGSEKNIPHWKKDRFGDLSTELLERSEFGKYVTKEKVDIFLKHRKSVINHSATVFHFTSWPLNENFEEDDSRNLLALINLVRQEIGKPKQNFTIAAHDSSGGVGGAATFIVTYQMVQDLDSKLRESESGKPTVGFLNIYDKVNELRKKRAHMVPSYSNYKFLFSTLAYYASNKANFNNVLPPKNDYGDEDIFGTYYGLDEDANLDVENQLGLYQNSRPISNIYVN